MNCTKNTVVGVVVLLIVSAVLITVYNQTRGLLPVQKVTNLNKSAPTDLLATFPIEAGAEVDQSYSLDYDEQKQHTVVFQSTKTVAENYSLYTNFLKEQNWNPVTRHETPKSSSLYGTKEGVYINVFITEKISTSSVKSLVSVNILKQ